MGKLDKVGEYVCQRSLSLLYLWDSGAWCLAEAQHSIKHNSVGGAGWLDGGRVDCASGFTLGL